MNTQHCVDPTMAAQSPTFSAPKTDSQPASVTDAGKVRLGGGFRLPVADAGKVRLGGGFRLPAVRAQG
jgi:hypothetical protein